MLFRSVATYHAAFCDEVGVYQLKFCWDQIVSFFSPGYQRNSSSALEQNVLFQQRIFWKYLDYLLKWEKWRNKPLAKLGLSTIARPREFWISISGRRWLNLAIRARRLFRIIQVGLPQDVFFQKRRGTGNLDSINWVDTNQKALRSSGPKGLKSKKVA